MTGISLTAVVASSGHANTILQHSPQAPVAGYWLVSRDGAVTAYGGAQTYGSVYAKGSHAVAISATPDAEGYWVVTAAGGVFGFGDAKVYGDLGKHSSFGPAAAPIVGIATTVDGQGYWLADSRGHVYSFGDAHFFGPRHDLHLSSPVTSIVAAPQGGGYWLVSRRGEVRAFGEAHLYPSSSNPRLGRDVVGMAATPDGQGYWLAAKNGHVAAYGDALAYGATGVTAGSIVGIAPSPDGQGYWLAGSEGSVWGFGDAGVQALRNPALQRAGHQRRDRQAEHHNYTVAAITTSYQTLTSGSTKVAKDHHQSTTTSTTSTTTPATSSSTSSPSTSLPEATTSASSGDAVTVPLSSTTSSTTVPVSPTTSTTTAPTTTTAASTSTTSTTTSTTSSSTTTTLAPALQQSGLAPPITICANTTYIAPDGQNGNPLYDYTGSAGAYASGKAGLPTFGSAGTNFPNATSGVAVAPGTVNLASYQSANTVYYFEPGNYTVTGAASPGANTAYVGGYSGGAYAVWDGGRSTGEAIYGNSATGVTVEYLTVQNFMPPSGHAVVNDQGSGTAWTVEHTTMTDNGNVQGSSDGPALQMAANDVYEYNCLSNNGQYAINAAAQGGWQDTFVNPVISYNEISYNGISYYPDNKGCGCSGGVKFWQAWNAQFVDNYVHNNYLAGVWFDTNNTGFLVKGNYFSDNYAFGISAEISYNGDITGNTFIDNAIGNHSAALFVNQSGGYPLPGSDYSGQFLVTNNTLVNNWDGIVVFNDDGRYCGQGGDSVCTLQPSYWAQTDFSICKGNYGNPYGAPSGASAPYDYQTLCSWTARNVKVSGNVISTNPATVAAMTSVGCSTGNVGNSAGYNYCGMNGEWSFDAGGPQYRGTISSSQPAAPGQASMFTGSQTITLTASPPSGTWSSSGWIADGGAVLSFSGVTGSGSSTVLTGVKFVSGSGTQAIAAGNTIAFINTGCTDEGAPDYACYNQYAQGTQFNWGNSWSGNTYYGPTLFATFDGALQSWSTWSGSPATSTCSGNATDGSGSYNGGCSGPFGEDAGGSFSSSGGPYWSYPAGHPEGVS